jgi:opacity protein-like surface antigen
MFRINWNRILAVVFLMLAGFQSVEAQKWHDLEWEAIPFGGGSFVPDFTIPTSVQVGTSQVASQTVGMKYAAGYQAGGRIKQNVNPWWAADLEYSFNNQPMTFTNLTPTIPSLAVSQSIHDFTYNVSYLPFEYWHRFHFYARTGAGASLFFIHENSKDEAAQLGIPLHNSWKFAFNWGGGFNFAVTDEVKLTLNFSDLMTGVPAYGLPRSAQVVNGVYLPGLATSGLMNHTHVNFGISFQFNDWQ